MRAITKPGHNLNYICVVKQFSSFEFFFVVYFRPLSVARLCNIVFNGRMMDEWWIGSSHGLMEVLSHNFPGETEESKEMSTSGYLSASWIQICQLISSLFFPLRLKHMNTRKKEQYSIPFCVLLVLVLQ